MADKKITPQNHRTSTEAQRLFLFSVFLCGFCVSVMCLTTDAAEEAPQPSAKRGFIRVVNGLVLEWPKTIVESTKQGPPIVGTMVGAVAGFSRAVVEVVEGTVEMAGGVSARPSR